MGVFFCTKLWCQKNEYFTNLYPENIHYAYKVTNCDKSGCVPDCWDGKICLACSQNILNPPCSTKNKEICMYCPYCEWDNDMNECITRNPPLVDDSYDTEIRKSVDIINIPWQEKWK